MIIINYQFVKVVDYLYEMSTDRSLVCKPAVIVQLIVPNSEATHTHTHTHTYPQSIREDQL